MDWLLDTFSATEHLKLPDVEYSKRHCDLSGWLFGVGQGVAQPHVVWGSGLSACFSGDGGRCQAIATMSLRASTLLVLTMNSVQLGQT